MRREASFQLARRPKGQSLFRKLGCIGGLCGLFFSSLLVFAVIIYFNLQRLTPHLPPIPSGSYQKYDKSQLVQPFFVDGTRFDVLASIWTAGNQTRRGMYGNQSHVQDQVLWTGLLQSDVSFQNGTIQNVTLPMDLDLSYLGTFADLERYSLMATISIFPRMSTAALSLPRNENFTIEQIGSILTGGLPLNLAFLDKRELTPDVNDKSRLSFKNTAAMPIHTVPLLFVKRKGKEQQVYMNTKVQIKVERQLDSFNRGAFMNRLYNTASNLGNCYHSVENATSSDDREKCFNTEFYGPVQTLLECKRILKGEVSQWNPNQNLKHSQSLEDSSRFFFVPYIVLKTSTSPRDLVPISFNETVKSFNFTTEVQVLSPEANRSFSITVERPSQSFGQIALDGKMEIQEIEDEASDDLFSAKSLFYFAISLLKGLAEYGVVFFSVLYFHTRATTVGISLPAVFFVSFFYLLEIVFSKFVLPSTPRSHCDAALYWEKIGYWLLPWIYLSFLQLWFVSRLKIDRQKRKWNFLTLRQIPADHSERQSAREDDELSMVSRVGLLMSLTMVLSVLKPQCFYLQIGAIGNFSLPANNLKLVLFALPQAGRIMGEVMQLRFNRQQRTFAGAFKITVILQALRHLLDLAVVIGLETQEEDFSKVDFIKNTSSILLTLAWVVQSRYYRSVPQLRDEDQQDQDE